MEKKKLVSTRLDPQTLEKIAKFQSRHTYWKRNTIISRVLDAVFENFDEHDIYDMVRFNRGWTLKASASFSMENATRKYEAAELSNL